MEVQKIVDEFFEEQFYNMTKYYLYKDKQLLKENKYEEFADKQIQKANKVWALIPGPLLFLYFGIKSFIQYGEHAKIFSFILGAVALMCFIGILAVSIKEYYIIKSSMNLFKKLVINKDKESSI